MTIQEGVEAKVAAGPEAHSVTHRILASTLAWQAQHHLLWAWVMNPMHPNCHLADKGEDSPEMEVWKVLAVTFGKLDQVMIQYQKASL